MIPCTKISILLARLSVSAFPRVDHTADYFLHNRLCLVNFWRLNTSSLSLRVFTNAIIPNTIRKLKLEDQLGNYFKIIHSKKRYKSNLKQKKLKSDSLEYLVTSTYTHTHTYNRIYRQFYLFVEYTIFNQSPDCSFSLTLSLQTNIISNILKDQKIRFSLFHKFPILTQKQSKGATTNFPY